MCVCAYVCLYGNPQNDFEIRSISEFVTFDSVWTSFFYFIIITLLTKLDSFGSKISLSDNKNLRVPFLRELIINI